MWYRTKHTALGLALSALAVAAGGCATTPRNDAIAYSKPDERMTGPQPPRANTIYGMTRLMRSQGKVEQAELSLVGLTREFPNYSPTYNDLAEIRLQQGRLEEAVDYINAGLNVAPNDAVLLNNAGVCALLKHDYPKALAYFKRASIIAPYENRYRANVALAMGLNGDAEGSRALYYQVVSADAADRNTELIKELLAPQELITPAD
jgi:Flp pilus assembly protein TadD